MDQQLPLSEPGPSTSAGPNAGESCNECKRRRGKCDRQLPECGPCARNKRHCLYERHSKTPLTRKHLTAVEERLRQAELKLRAAEGRERQLKDALLEKGSERTSERRFSIGEGQGYQNAGKARHLRQPSEPFTKPNDSLSPVDIKARDGSTAQTYSLEEAPPGADDFSWNEQSPSEASGFDYLANPGEGQQNITDGMAALSVDEGTGYLGLASGAAMLKILLPGTENRRPTRPRYSIPKSDPAMPAEYGWISTPLYHIRGVSEIDLHAAFDSYFSSYHLCFPLVHEPTFRAQYAKVLPRPGSDWNALAYMVGAIGLFSGVNGSMSRHADLFEAAKSNISIASLETGTITLVQTLTLMCNYLQKSNRPNSGYNYLGLALHMAMGLGLHKEFRDWQIAPLSMEIRRRVWWTLFVFYSGAMLTFGRPVSLPTHGIDVSLPLNVDDAELTYATAGVPSPKARITTGSAVAEQARFHLATNAIYAQVISSNPPTAAELLRLDDECIEAWRILWANDPANIPGLFRLSRSIMDWRYRNFRIIMYRPFLIKHALRTRSQSVDLALDPPTRTAIDRCLHEATGSIAAIHSYWFQAQKTGMDAWYSLFFIFQASLIPIIMLRNQPQSESALAWQTQVASVVQVLESMHSINPASKECHQVILRLCGHFLPQQDLQPLDLGTGIAQPTDESPQTQLAGLYPLMWPNATSTDFDALMPDDSWTTFFADAQNDGGFNFNQCAFEPD
ncbi:Lactose regulatory LAC9 [Lecanosticta acicola]|uniref:Lactose regulatory LAC9 n=1 Tax=Lecanosticta acicola TaxID=111012 RepID=A0AAI9ECL8_9PEZI|nr:Lactose regulatory LAC9 [Lecanosticta acicola]